MSHSNTKYTLPVCTDPETGDPFIELPPEVIETLGVGPGDTVRWVDRGDGSFELQPPATKIFIVETIQTFRHVYLIEGRDSVHAADSVVMKEFDSTFQCEVDESVISHREATDQEIIRLSKELKEDGWFNQQKLNDPKWRAANIHKINYTK